MDFQKKMDSKNLLPLRMNALIFTYIAAAPFIISQDFLDLTLLQITGIAVPAVILENLWNLKRDKPVMDERKQEILTNGMSWGYIAITLSLITALGTGIQPNTALIRGTMEFGVWIFVLYLSLNLLYQNFGGDEK